MLQTVICLQKLKDANSHPVEQIPLDSVPVLRISLNELTRMKLDAQEGFVLSRINGEWDLGAILKLCPMSKQQVLIIVRRLLDDDVIEMTERPPWDGNHACKLPAERSRCPNQEV